MELRPTFEIRFADGGIMALGSKTRVMGVLNVTPDSFSDGGLHTSVPQALVAAARMVADGADLIDVGGESSRPGAGRVSAALEVERVVPVIERIKRDHEIRVSVDTNKAEVARQALDAGADMVNDISALATRAMLELVCDRRVPVVLMHMRGTPRTMQHDTHYEDLVGSVVGFLEERIDRAVSAGVKDGKILVDPGLGFGKSAEGNLTILRRLHVLASVERPILVGASRKAFIGKTLDLPVTERLEGSLAVAAYASAQGAHVIRAHDVAATVRTVRMIAAIREA